MTKNKRPKGLDISWWQSLTDWSSYVNDCHPFGRTPVYHYFYSEFEMKEQSIAFSKAFLEASEIDLNITNMSVEEFHKFIGQDMTEGEQMSKNEAPALSRKKQLKELTNGKADVYYNAPHTVAVFSNGSSIKVTCMETDVYTRYGGFFAILGTVLFDGHKNYKAVVDAGFGELETKEFQVKELARVLNILLNE